MIKCCPVCGIGFWGDGFWWTDDNDCPRRVCDECNDMLLFVLGEDGRPEAHLFIY